MAEESPTALRITTSKRQAFDSYFPLDGADEQTTQEAIRYDADLASLPFPAPLTSLRENFRGEKFDCDEFLIQHQKHGQLDDLSKELRSLSALLENELVKGVEDDYEAFIGLGRLDSRKVDDLRRGVVAVTQSMKKIEADVQQNLTEVESILAAKKALRKKKNAARATLRISRGVDELAYLLDDGSDLEICLESYEGVQDMTKKKKVPEFEAARYADLQVQLKNKLDAALKSATGDDKLDIAILMRRFIQAAHSEEVEE